MKINAIVAVDKDNLIGYKNELVWHIPEDLIFFKKMTKEKIIIMGRKTFESLPNGPLPRRINIVVTKDFEKFHNHPYKNTFFVSSVEDAIHKANELAVNNFFDFEINDEEIFVIGGATMYEHFLKNELIDIMYVTKIDKSFSQENALNHEDCSFLNLKYLENFKKEKIKDIEGFDMTIEIYKYYKITNNFDIDIY